MVYFFCTPSIDFAICVLICYVLTCIMYIFKPVFTIRKQFIYGHHIDFCLTSIAIIALVYKSPVYHTDVYTYYVYISIGIFLLA